ncbi:MAG TPA: PP2C family protein-serine/threonine phosphatase [Mycobacteriales bacterium]|nr:PP2C family protein-serine/threonine phosphatase [Mycobacteriales bacterium]
MSGTREASAGAGQPPLTDAERGFGALLEQSHLAAPHELPEFITRHARPLGVVEATPYLADLQQHVLVPFLPSGGPEVGRQVEPLDVESTLAGRAYQQIEVLTQEAAGGRVRVWMPLLDGAERLGVLEFVIPDHLAADVPNGLFGARLHHFATLVAELIMTKTMYGDTIVRLRRRAEMGLAAEMQWTTLPPLTFSGREVTIAAALEPAYEVAGDTVDYAVDAGVARAAVFDGMGHGLRSAQLATLAVAAYRNCRRADRSLPETAIRISGTLAEAFAGTAFSTAVLAELDTGTGVLTWVNAGHPEPLLLREGKLVGSLHTRPMLPLGMRISGRPPDTDIMVGREQLQPDDRVLLYTDGVTEARSPTGDFFGERALADLLVRNLAAGLPTAETMRRLVRALLDHQQGQLTDDATMLLLEWRSDNTAASVPGVPGVPG